MTGQINDSGLLPIGTTLQGGKYRVERYMASGGFGNTYEVTHLKLNRRFALKEFFLRGDCLRDSDGRTVTVSNPTKTEVFTSMRAKFEKEAQRMYDLTEEGCPHVVRITDLFDENQTSYYVMELIEGESLGKRLSRTGQPMPEQEVMRLLPQILEALDGVHRRRIWHLDLKPDNLMVDARGHLTLIDFGASKQLSASGNFSTTLSAMCYTPGYAPSEQIDQNLQNIGPWTDLYALGATLYRLVTNQTPPQSSELITALFSGQDVFRFTPTVSDRMQQLIRWMMNPAIPNRPQSVADIRQRLKEPQQHEPAITQPEQEQPSDAKTQIVEEQQKKDDNPDYVPPKTMSAWKWIVPLVAVFAIGLTAILINRSSSLNQEAGDDDSNAVELPTPPDEYETFTVGDVSFRMIKVDGGSFTMGATSEQGSDANDDEKPAHQVTLSSYYIGETEVTQELWQAVMGSNPSNFKGSQCPVECVSWEDCQEFISRLNAKTGRNFRLPTEAEWEYAARGGRKSNGYKYAGGNNIGDVAWYDGNSYSQTHIVGLKRSNELGLYDMAGNVWEWCQDWYGDYSSSSQTNPTGASTGSYRVYRGGSWNFYAAWGCRVSLRGYLNTSYGFDGLGLRLAL